MYLEQLAIKEPLHRDKLGRMSSAGLIFEPAFQRHVPVRRFAERQLRLDGDPHLRLLLNRDRSDVDDQRSAELVLRRARIEPLEVVTQNRGNQMIMLAMVERIYYLNYNAEWVGVVMSLPLLGGSD